MFTKIKYKQGELTLEWQDGDDQETVVHSMTSSDDPRPEFHTALQALTAHVLTSCQLPLDYADEMKIIGVALSENDHQGRGVVVTAVKKLPGLKAPLVINTPHMTEAEGDQPGALHQASIELVETLSEEARLFRKGERAQQELPLGKAA